MYDTDSNFAESIIFKLDPNGDTVDQYNLNDEAITITTDNRRNVYITYINENRIDKFTRNLSPMFSKVTAEPLVSLHHDDGYIYFMEKTPVGSNEAAYGYMDLDLNYVQTSESTVFNAIEGGKIVTSADHVYFGWQTADNTTIIYIDDKLEMTQVIDNLTYDTDYPAFTMDRMNNYYHGTNLELARYSPSLSEILVYEHDTTITAVEFQRFSLTDFDSPSVTGINNFLESIGLGGTIGQTVFFVIIGLLLNFMVLAIAPDKMVLVIVNVSFIGLFMFAFLIPMWVSITMFTVIGFAAISMKGAMQYE